jgi:phosphohistidine swiveling domain-containing protein
MSTATVRRLRDLRMTDVAEVGGKAAGLGELFADGVRVPDGVVLTAEAAELSSDQRRALLDAGMAELGEGPFAVRSSGIAEDGAALSYAGMYESVLNVAAPDVPAAADRSLASAHTAHAGAYGTNGVDRMAVIVQRMVTPAAAGVALTADPVTGDRGATVVTAVRGLGERLVSGAAVGDEWVVQGNSVTARRQPELAINRRQAAEVANAARHIADARGTPQDIEWAIDGGGTLWFLQARPMTALPDSVSWTPPAPGAYTRQLRMGEWIGAPVTPLFESWLLSAMEDGMHAMFKEEIGQGAPRPYHVVVNGWYFYSINFLSGPAMIRSLPGMLWHLIRSPRRLAGVLPRTVRHSFPIAEREWRAGIQPRYRRAVANAEERVEMLPVSELPALIDELASLAGEYFGWIAALGGAAYKMEMNLAQFFRRHLSGVAGDSHLPLLAGIDTPAQSPGTAVASLDWSIAPMPSGTPPQADHDRLVAERTSAERAASEALAPSPKRLAEFRRLLADSQHLIPIREEQVAELTISWPVMRRAVLRIGDALVQRGVISQPDDIFFLTRDEAFAGLAGNGAPAVDVADRRAQLDAQARLSPPLLIGKMNPMLKKMWEGYPRALGAEPSDRAIVTGTPASAGRATGPVRVIRGPEEFGLLQPGDVLVAPMTAPAWTPLFIHAAAVVTDVGSPAAHASIIAREYGIPAVVGCGDATARLRNGMLVTVDGGTGNVEPADRPT